MAVGVTRRSLLVTVVGGLATLAVRPATGAGPPGERITVYILGPEQGVKGPDGKGHAAFVPSSFVVRAGVPVEFEVINYDEGAHTMTAPDLGLDIQIKPGRKSGAGVAPVATTASWTPGKRGSYRWYCGRGCDASGGGWAMETGYTGPGREGYMAGFIVVL
jgi:plastocyanin